MKGLLVIGASLLVLPAASADQADGNATAAATVAPGAAEPGGAAAQDTSVALATSPLPGASSASSAASGASPVSPSSLMGTKSAWRSGRMPQLLWTGFRAKDDGGEVLIQTSAEVEMEVRPAKEGATLLLKRCRAGRPIDNLPLDTRYFSSPVTRVSVRQRAGNLEIAISLRQPVTATPRKEAGPGGSWFWVIGFPAAESRTTTAAVTR